MSRAEIEAGYAISRRIEAEERALDAALLVFTSTQQEVKDQWGLYDGCEHGRVCLLCTLCMIYSSQSPPAPGTA